MAEAICHERGKRKKMERANLAPEARSPTLYHHVCPPKEEEEEEEESHFPKAILEEEGRGASSREEGEKFP